MARAAIVLASILLVLGACGRTADLGPETETAALLVEPAAGPAAAGGKSIPWPDAESCADLVDLVLQLDRGAAQRLERESAPLVLLPLMLLRGEQTAGVTGGELPIPTLAARPETDAPCVLLLGRPTPLEREPDRILGRQTVHSSYQTGTKRRRNPDHQALEKELATARREAERGFDLVATGDPLLDLIGMVAGSVIGGVDAVVSGNELQELEAAIDATPAFIEDPILTPYRYERADVAAERRFAVPAALHDRRAGAIWSTVITLSEAERFAVVDGRHAKDAEGPLAADGRILTAAELASWHAEAPPLEDRALLTHLAAAIRAGEPTTGSLDDALAMLQKSVESTAMPASLQPAAGAGSVASSSRSEPVAPDRLQMLPADALAELPEPAAGDVVRGGIKPLLDNLVRAGEAELPGFYVSPEHILVPAAALGRSSLLSVRYADGMRAYGLVELVEEDLGVALVYLPRPGEALPLAAGGSPPPAATGEPGVPWGTEAAILGVFVEDPLTGERRWIESAQLERLVAQADRL